ncbi:DUF4190 domain-containing protein [Streptomyces sp. CAU 1734]|uniref:DUF4190 domain-containing protein n=1 Tax=Streptomyces sp. CAU 1734 TaxID=3140360 RepID=UPI0032616C60
MSDQRPQPSGAPEPRDSDPWAPPQHNPGRKAHQWPAPGQGETPAPGTAQPGFGGPSPHVHSQPTVTSVPLGDAGAVPPPPPAPGAAGQPPTGAYGYPAAPGGQHPPAGPGDTHGMTHSAYPAYPGYPGYAQQGLGWQPPMAPSNGQGTAAMVLGILAVAFFCFAGVPGIVFGALALTFGILGRKRARRGEATNDGMALSGIILGSIGLVLGLAALLIWVFAYAAEESSRSGESVRSGAPAIERPVDSGPPARLG